MKKIFLILIFLLLVNIVFANPYFNRISYKIDFVNYNIFLEKGSSFSEKDIELFHKKFVVYADSLYRRFNVKFPSNINVSITSRAWIFKDLTGLSGNFAGAYNSERDILYFQNIRSRRMVKILDKVIQHELLHKIIKEEGKITNEKFWMEEILCEGLFPLQYSTLKYKTSKRLSYKKFLKRLKIGLQSSNSSYKIRQRAYYYAGSFGKFLITRMGEKKLFEFIVNRKDPMLLKKYYREFVK